MSDLSKICSKCKEPKDPVDFNKNKASRDGLRHTCKKCDSESTARWRKENPEKYRSAKKKWQEDNREASRIYAAEYAKQNKDARRESQLKYKYNLTVEQYNQMLEDQDYVCAICFGVNEGEENLSVDHDHSCCPGIKSCGFCVRGLLCRRCNSGLGSFQDNENFVQSALMYLQE